MMRVLVTFWLAGALWAPASAQFIRGPNVVSSVLPSANAAWFADDISTTIPEYTGGGAGVMTLQTGAVSLKYVTAAGAWVYFPAGVTTNSITAPYNAVFNVLGDNELHLKAQAVDWTPGLNRYLFTRGISGSVEQWVARILGSPSGTFQIIQDNTTAVKTSSAAVGATNGTATWLRARFDVGTDVTFDTGTDGASWSDLGTAQSDIGVASSQTSHPLILGASAASGVNQWEGGIYRMRWFSDLGTTLIANFDAADFTDANLNTCTDSLGHVYTINRAASGLQAMAVKRSMFVGNGTSGYASVADHATLDCGTGSWSVHVLCVIQNVSASRALIANKTGTGQGWMINISGTGITGNASDGTDNVTTGSTTFSQGAVTLVSLIRDVNTLYVAKEGVRDAGTSVTAVGSVTNANALHILAANAAGSYADGVGVLGVSIFNSVASSPAQCVALRTEMLAQTITP